MVVIAEAAVFELALALETTTQNTEGVFHTTSVWKQE